MITMTTDSPQRTPAQQVAYLSYRWGESRKRARDARGPTAAQSATRASEQYEAELKALGAVRVGRNLRWTLPASK